MSSTRFSFLLVDADGANLSSELGIGYETTKVSSLMEEARARLELTMHFSPFLSTQALVAHSCKVYILGRSPLKAQTVIEKLVLELPEVQGARELVHFVEIDLADLKSVRVAGDELKRSASFFPFHFRTRTDQRLRLRRLEPYFDILINNAGVRSFSLVIRVLSSRRVPFLTPLLSSFVSLQIMTPSTNKPTAQGIESQWGTNVLGPHFLTTILLPSLLASPNKAQGFLRVVNVSGLGHQVLVSSEGVEFNTLKFKGEVKGLAMKENEKLFGQSKLVSWRASTCFVFTPFEVSLSIQFFFPFSLFFRA